MSRNLEASSSEIEDYINLCKDCRQTDDPEMIVLSTSLLRVFDEITAYLDYFENEIEKKFGDFDKEKEWKEIKALILESQNLKLNLKEGFNDSEKGIRVVNEIIKTWEKYPRKYDSEILSRLEE